MRRATSRFEVAIRRGARRMARQVRDIVDRDITERLLADCPDAGRMTVTVQDEDAPPRGGEGV